MPGAAEPAVGRVDAVPVARRAVGGDAVGHANGDGAGLTLVRRLAPADNPIG